MKAAFLCINGREITISFQFDMISHRQDTLQDHFRRCTLEFPTKVAVTYDDGENEEHTTYEDLASTATEISSFLEALCEGEESVAVYANQNTTFVASILGVLQVSCAFAPIGTEWPPKTAYSFVRNLGITSVLVDIELLETFEKLLFVWKSAMPKGNRFKFYENELLTRNGFVLLKIADAEVAVRVKRAVPLAYVMQTSGTTGEPKTVQVPHSCIVSNVTHLRSIFEMSQDDAVFLVAPSTFDPFVVQMFLALSTGARLVLVPEDLKKIPSALCRILFDRQKVTVFQPTPSLMYHIGSDLIKSKVLNSNSSLRVLAFGGEHCPTLSVLRQWTHTECPTQLFNLYGITEVSCWATCHHITKDELHRNAAVNDGETSMVSIPGLDVGFSRHQLLNNSVPIGAPLQDTIVEVWDGRGELVKEGIGQIHIGGAGRVCLLGNETDVTMATMRGTGDWAFVKEGTIWYCGRTDRQIKRNGKRINLDWIERTISEALGYTCSLLAEESPQGNLQRLYLFVVAVNSDRSFHEFRSLVRKVVGELLPAFAQPDVTYFVPRLPVTSHGKVDKAALLAALRPRGAAESTISVRRFLERAWAEALGVHVSSLFDLFDRSQVDPAAEKDANWKQQEFEEAGEEIKDICVDDEDMFVISGGSSLAAVRLADNVESWMRQRLTVPLQATELVDIILNKSFSNLCAYVEGKMTMNDTSERGGTGTDVLPSNHILAFVESRDRDVQSTCNTERNDGGNWAVLSEKFSEKTKPCNLAVDRSDHSQEKPGGLIRKASVECIAHWAPKRTKVSSRETVPSSTQLVCGPELAGRAARDCYCSVSRGMQQTTCLPCQDRCANVPASTVNETSADVQPTHKPSQTNVVKVTEKWRTSLYKCIDASPLVVTASERQDGGVYVGSHGHVFMAVRLSDGHVLWEREVGDRVESSAVLSACGTYVIVGCYDGKLYVFERFTGVPEWTPQTEGPIKSSPIVDPKTGVVWVGSHDQHLYGFDVTKKRRVCAVHCGGGACFSSPRASQEPHVIYTATLSGVVIAVDAGEHTVTWRQRCPKAVFASPVVFSSGVLCACVDDAVYCFSHQGEALWEYRTNDAVFCTPALFEAEHPSNSLIVFGSHDCHVYCLDTQGRVTWSFSADAQVYCTPFITPLSRDSHLPRDQHVRGGALTVFVFSTVGTLFVLDLKSGRLLASVSLPGEVFSSPVVVGDQLIVGCRNDFLYSLEIQETSLL